MGGVTKEQIARAREIDVLDYVLTYERDNVRRVGNSYRMKDHPSIEVNTGKWRWYSQGLHGRTALDYLTDVRGYGLVEAVCALLGEKSIERSTKPVAKIPMQSITPNELPERKPFALPLRNQDNRRVIAYLQSRGIDRDLILDCIERGVLYERATFHDCVFTGKDERGKTRFAALRSTTSSLKRDMDGSDKRYAFTIPPNDPDSREIAVFEAPVDCLSHQTLCKQGFIPQYDGWRISLGGTSLSALTHFLENHPKVTHCLVCTDNDEAGELAAVKIAELSVITVARSPPLTGNDWNDALGAMQKAERTKNRARHCDEPCL